MMKVIRPTKLKKVETEKTDTKDKLEDDFCNFDDKLFDQTD